MPDKKRMVELGKQGAAKDKRGSRHSKHRVKRKRKEHSKEENGSRECSNSRKMIQQWSRLLQAKGIVGYNKNDNKLVDSFYGTTYFYHHSFYKRVQVERAK